MKDIFIGDIFNTIQPPRSVHYELVGTPLPTNQDYYFIAKWHELFERYMTARMFIRKSLENNCDYWFCKLDNEQAQRIGEYTIKGDLYEAALINYNILVDLTWTWAYVSAEYALYKFDDDGNVVNAKDICGLHTIEESYELLRETEKGASTPHEKGNPFSYLKQMRPEFSDAIDTIIDFWKPFSNSTIRKLYNFIKHRGKPLYKEIEDLRGRKIMSIFINREEYPSDIRDVQKIISVDDGVQELIDFDNTHLFPYFKKLLDQLKKAVNPSPMAYV